jgi:hypothetical protein
MTYILLSLAHHAELTKIFRLLTQGKTTNLPTVNQLKSISLMKPENLLLLVAVALAACNQPKPAETKTEKQPIVGTWQLVSDIIITKGDTAIAYPVKGKPDEMIKMYNDTHFAFFQHDLKHGKIDTPFFSSGAGTYSLKGDDYTEHLMYCTARMWEGHDFKFKLTIHNDTLTQRGIEKIDSLKVNREIIETYVRKH